MRKGMVALIGMILALVFIIVALVGPWYGMSIKYTYGTTEIKADATMSLTSTTSTDGSTTQTVSHADSRKTAEAAGSDTGLYDIFNITLALTVITLILAIMAFLFILGYAFNFGKPNMMKNLAMVFGIITFVLALVAVFYFMVTVPGETNSSFSTLGLKDVGFWYSTSVTGASISLGPGFAWYLMLAAGIIALISFIFVFMDKRAVPVYQNPAP